MDEDIRCMIIIVIHQIVGMGSESYIATISTDSRFCYATPILCAANISPISIGMGIDTCN